MQYKKSTQPCMLWLRTLRTLWIIATLSGILAACGQPDGLTGQMNAPMSVPTEVVPTSPTEGTSQNQTTMHVPIVPSPTQSFAMQTQVAEKVANEMAIAIYDATSAALSTPLPDDGLPIDTPAPTPTFATGIQECDFVDHDYPFGVWTCWHDIQGGTYRTILTGGKPGTTASDTTTAGGIEVCTLVIADNTGACSAVSWQHPVAGRLIIVDVTWPHVVVEAANGKLYGFNAETLAWEAPQAVPSTNTPTSLPTNTPTARPTSTPTALPTNTPLPTATSTPAPAVTNAAVRPVLECVRAEANGQYTAFFGYKNDNTAALTIAVGTNNRFSPNPQARGQTTQFASGRQVSVFGVAFDGTNLVWSLKGPDGQNRTATAASGSKRCAP